MRRFLIRLVQVFALAMIGTSFLADTSFAETPQEVRAKVQQACYTMGGTFITVPNGDYSCYLPSLGNVVQNCRKAGICSFTECKSRGCTHTPWVDLKTGKTVKPTKREDGTTIMTAGTTTDRYGRTPMGASTSGAPVNGVLNGIAPSQTAPAVSTGAALNTQAATGLGGVTAVAPSPTLPSAGGAFGVTRPVWAPAGSIINGRRP